MFCAIIFIAIGLALLLNAMGLLSGSFWGVFWGILFLAVGIRMLLKNKYKMAEWDEWQGVIRERVNGHCCQDHKEPEAKTSKKK